MKIMNEIKWEEKSVVLKTHVFWEATPLRLVNSNRCFGVAYCLLLHGQEVQGDNLCCTARSVETSATTYGLASHNISEDLNLQQHHC
jgi:hypothetical protein